MLVLCRMTSSRRARASFCFSGQDSVLVHFLFPCAAVSWVFKRVSRSLRVFSQVSRSCCTSAWLVASLDGWRYQTEAFEGRLER